jgi:hypothetical protein
MLRWPPQRANLDRMTATGDVLNQVVPTLIRLAHRPGGFLLRVATAVIGVFALLGLTFALADGGSAKWVPLVLAGILAVPVAVLAVRRERLQVQAEGLGLHPTIGENPRAMVVYDGSGSRDPLAEEMDSLTSAMVESTVLTARFFPRIEAAQRAALLAAGGPVNAPYLRDDLRVTLAALIGTLAAVPLGTLGAMITAILLLSP